MTSKNPSSLKPGEEEWIEFPCVFPLKVMGDNDGSYPDFVLEVAKKYIDGVDESCVKTKESRTGKYISVTVTFMAHNREQLDAVYYELNCCERTRMTL